MKKIIDRAGRSDDPGRRRVQLLWTGCVPVQPVQLV